MTKPTASASGSTVVGAAWSMLVATGWAWLVHARHALDGPTLVHRGSALAEVVVVIAVFSASGWLLLHRRRRS